MAGRDIKEPYSDIRWREPIGMGIQLWCNICSNFHRNPQGPISCSEYPDGIPSDLLDLDEDDPKPKCYKPIDT